MRRLLNWFRPGSQARRSNPRPQQSFRPTLEQLEDTFS
jgi:hypothetical protein